MLFENMTILSNLLFSLFAFYNTALTFAKTSFEQYYNNHSKFKFTYDLIYYFGLLFDSYAFNYPIEPFSNYWMNSVIICVPDNSENKNHFLENYETIPYQLEYEKKEIKNCLIDLIIENKKFNFKINIDCIESLFIIKYNDKYIFKTNLYNIKPNDILDKKKVSNPFYEIKYTNLDSGLYTVIELPNNYLIEGNEILSNAFIKRYIDYHLSCDYKDNFLYSSNYSIEITDFCFSAKTLDKNSYVLLSDSDFTIQKIK